MARFMVFAHSTKTNAGQRAPALFWSYIGPWPRFPCGEWSPGPLELGSAYPYVRAAYSAAGGSTVHDSFSDSIEMFANRAGADATASHVLNGPGLYHQQRG